jgi:hypothetical protein
MKAVGDESEKDLANGERQSSEAVGVGGDEIFEGEGSGFVKEDMAHPPEPGPQGRVSKIDAMALKPRRSDVIKEGEGHPDGARARNDKHGDQNLKGCHPVGSREPPSKKSCRRQEKNRGQITANQFLERPRPSRDKRVASWDCDQFSSARASSRWGDTLRAPEASSEP